jgi:hypothetical protein
MPCAAFLSANKAAWQFGLRIDQVIPIQDVSQLDNASTDSRGIRVAPGVVLEFFAASQSPVSAHAPSRRA